MAKDLSTTTLQKAADRIVPRLADPFIEGDDGAGATQWYPMGIVEDVSIEFSPITQNADVAGREKQLAVEFSVSMVLQQTAQEELANLKEVVTPVGSGATVKICASKTAAADVDTADGFEFGNVFPRFSGEINGQAEGSSFTVEFGGKVMLEAFDSFSGTISVDV